MPIYDYTCSNGHRFEHLQGFDGPSPTRCGEKGCRARRFERQLSAEVGIHFKGSGFHNTDYPRQRAAAQAS